MRNQSVLIGDQTAPTRLTFSGEELVGKRFNHPQYRTEQTLYLVPHKCYRVLESQRSYWRDRNGTYPTSHTLSSALTRAELIAKYAPLAAVAGIYPESKV